MRTKDIKFKNIIEELLVKNNSISVIENNLNEFYHPDGVLIYKEYHYILEHSSTGDRKVHLGELIQAYEYSIRNNHKVVLIIILDNQTKTAPKKDAELKRLNYYLNFLKIQKIKHNNSFEVRVKDILEVDNSEKLNQIILKDKIFPT
jgi:hypothetical protein